MKKVFTTGQVAQICKVAPRTVSKWFDSGRLKGYRLPGCEDRRIPREQLIRFLKENNMPLGELETEELLTVLLVSGSVQFRDSLASRLTETAGFRVIFADCPFQAGEMTVLEHPDVFVVDGTPGQFEKRAVIQAIRRNPNGTERTVFAIADEDENGTNKYDESGATETLYRPFDVQLLVERITTLRGIKLAA